MKCWCGNEIKDIERTDKNYVCCSSCGTYLSCVDVPDVKEFYSFADYWHRHQTQDFGFPPIEGRSINDFNDRIPVWWNVIKGLNQKWESVLEIGCAHGGFLKICKDYGFERCVGIEIDPATCEYAKSRFGLEEIYSAVFPDVDIKGKFDYICAFDIFEHFTNPLTALLKMKDMLNDGGYIFIQTPMYNGQSGFQHFKKDEHLFIFTEKSLQKIFSEAGLAIESIGPGVFSNDSFILGRKLKKEKVKK